MTINTLRAVDRCVGVPLCALLTLLRRLPHRQERAGAIRRIVFVKLAEQGSTVLAAGALQRAIDRVGRENVFFVVFEENRFILEAMNLIPVENLILFDVRSLLAAVRSAFSVVRRLRAIEADAAVDLEFFARGSAILAYLTRAGRRVGLHSFAGEGPYRGDLFTHRLVFNPYLHTSQLFLMEVEAIDWDALALPACPRPPIDLGPTDTRCRVPEKDLDAVAEMVKKETRRTEVPPIVLLNVNSSDLLPLRRWDGALYVALAQRVLSARPEAYVLFTGSPHEAARAEELAAAVSSPRCGSLAGRTGIRELLALYSLSKVLVTNDSGPAHFATLTPVEVVTLFGPETPALFAARTPRNQVLWAGLACSPCVNAFNNRVSRCRDNRCMAAISVDEVFEATIAAYMKATATFTRD